MSGKGRGGVFWTRMGMLIQFNPWGDAEWSQNYFTWRCEERSSLTVPRPAVPVAKARQVAVGAAFAGVLRRGLSVHLQDARTGPAQHLTDQVQIVHLHRGRGGLMRLVEALQHGGQQPLGVPEDSAARRIASAGTRQISATRCGEYSATRAANSS
jgi:hypothetical protein